MALDPTLVARTGTAAPTDERDRALAAAATPEARELKVRLAAAYQLLADRGLDDGIAGHISVRVPGAPHHFWVNQLGLLCSEITPDNLVLINHHGEILDGGPMINLAGFLIHEAIHSARPDVVCAAHTHPPAGCAFSSLAQPLAMIDQNTASFYDDVAVYGRYTGVVMDAAQSAEIALSLGDRRGLILQNHGLVTVAGTVEQAVLDMIDLESACDRNLRALATGQPLALIEAAAGLQARSVLSQPLRYAAQWAATMRDLARRNPIVASFLPSA